MTDPKGENGPAALTVADIGALVGGRVPAGADMTVAGIGPVDEARGDQMAFLATKRYVRHIPDSRASSFLVLAELETYLGDNVPRVVVDDPHPALRTVLAHFHPEPRQPVEVHRTAVLGRGVEIGERVSIGPYAVLEDGVRVGTGSRIGAHCVIGRNTSVGSDCILHPHVVTYHDTVLGDRVVVHSGSRLGSDGFGFTLVDGEHLKMPQVGRCIIEDDVEIGANSTVDRGSLGDTVLGRGSKTDNLVHLAHNVRVGARSLFAALVGVAGSTRVGEGVWMGGQVGVSDHLEIGDGARLAIATKLMRDVPAGETMSGHPARPHRLQMRRQAGLARLPKLMERVKSLEAEVSRLAFGP